SHWRLRRTRCAMGSERRVGGQQGDGEALEKSIDPGGGGAESCRGRKRLSLSYYRDSKSGGRESPTPPPAAIVQRGPYLPHGYSKTPQVFHQVTSPTCLDETAC